MEIAGFRPRTPAARIRWWLVSSRPRYVAAWWLTYVLAAIALVCLISGQIGAGVILAGVALLLAATVGLLPVPRTRLAYYQRTVRVLKDVAGMDWRRRGAAYMRASNSVREMTALRAPDRFSSEHQQLLQEMHAHIEKVSDRSIPLSQRTIEAVEWRQSRKRALDDLAASAVTDDERSYATASAKLRERSRRAAQRAIAEEESDAELALKRLRKIRAPDDLASRHEQLTEALGDYLTALQLFHSASIGYDRDEAETATVELEKRRGTLEDHTRPLWDDFGKQWRSGADSEESIPAQ